MVRVGGMGYAIDISEPMGSRICAMIHLRSGRPFEAAKTYSVAGWASVNQDTRGPPIWDGVAAHVARLGSVSIDPSIAVKVTGT